MSEVITEHLGYYRVTTTKAQIASEATAAALAGQSINDACRYPFGTACADHFKAVYLLTLPKSESLNP